MPVDLAYIIVNKGVYAGFLENCDVNRSPIRTNQLTSGITVFGVSVVVDAYLHEGCLRLKLKEGMVLDIEYSYFRGSAKMKR